MTVQFLARWTGAVFEPISRLQVLRCAENFSLNEVCHLEKAAERSPKSHRHLFSCIRSAWENLGDEDAQRFPTPESLRKYALIRAHHADSKSMTLPSRAAAERVAAFMESPDGHSIVDVSGSTIIVWTARSISERAIGAKEFQAVKERVLEIVADMIGLTAAELARQHTNDPPPQGEPVRKRKPLGAET